MAEYNKQTVAQLRQLLKDRGIPSTGLQRKAQIIERLEEADAAIQEASEATEVSDGKEDTPSEAADEPTPIPPPTSDPLPKATSPNDSHVSPPDTVDTAERQAEDTPMEVDPTAVQPPHVPAADPDEAVSTKAPEPSDAEEKFEKKEGSMEGELPDAPEPAAEVIQSTQQEIKASTEQSQQIVAETAPSPTLTEKPSIEKPELLPIPERSTAETSRLNTEELEADSRKRKRRSGTPELPSQDIRAKKHRPSGEGAPEVYLKEDVDVVMEQRPPEEHPSAGSPQIVPMHKDLPEEEPEVRREKKENISRYKNLINPSTEAPQIEAAADDRPTVPALHTVTSALYIRDFMRPLRPELLRAHLVSLASPPSSSPDATIVRNLFLDAMKTHALVSFSTKTAASRVRAALHGSVWPPEGNRKELWVDFIPDDRIEDWIREEEDAVLAEKEARVNGRSLAPKRFEVIYPESADGSVTAVFQEISSNSLSNANRGPRGSIDARRPAAQQPQHAPAPANNAPSKDTRQDIEASFNILDQLFQSTEAKPKLYYLPVSDEISETRLKELDQETSRDWAPGEIRKGRGIKSDIKYKYSYDNDDRIVEVGEDRGPWTEWSEGHRGGRGGYRGRGGGRGGAGIGYRGRGGQNWRG